MRHGRLVAAGLAAGAVLGFAGELLRPRPGRTAATGTPLDLTAPAPARPDAASDSLGPLRVGRVRIAGGTPYTDAVTLAMAARGLDAGRLAVATDGEVHG
jgi:hypothetical protein